jgi:hypothetical protein
MEYGIQNTQTTSGSMKMRAPWREGRTNCRGVRVPARRWTVKWDERANEITVHTNSLVQPQSPVPSSISTKETAALGHTATPAAKLLLALLLL